MKIAVTVSAILTVKGVNMQTPEVEMSVCLDKWEDVELNIDLMYKSLKNSVKKIPQKIYFWE